MMKIFSDISSTYNFCNSPVLKIVNVNSPELEVLNRLYSSIRRYCNDGLDVPSDFILSAWKIYYYLNNSLSPYSAIVSSLANEIEKIQDVYWATPELKEKVFLFVSTLQKVARSSDNKKLSSVWANIDASWRIENTGICHKLFGFSDLQGSDDGLMKAEPFSNFFVLSKSSDLNFFLDRVICLSPVRFLGETLIRKLFHAGYCKEVFLFLYPGETYRMPERLKIESSRCYEKMLSTYSFTRVYVDDNTALEKEDLDGDKDDFWSLFHGGGRTQAENLVEAVFVVLSTGEGTFLSLCSKVLGIRAIDVQVNEPQVRKIDVKQLSEGDYVCLRIQGNEAELDELTLSESEETGNIAKSISVEDWRKALESLSLTRTLIEIAQGISSVTKIHVSSVQLSQWMSGNVIGPRDYHTLAATVSFLVEEGAFNLRGISSLKASHILWDEISSFRADRVKAGHSIQRSIIEKLDSLIGDRKFDFPLIDATKGYFIAHQHLVARISALDDTTAYVTASKINFIDKFGSPAWLG